MKVEKQQGLTDEQLFVLKNQCLKGFYDEVQPMEFYRELFPEGSLGTPGNLDDRKPNMIVATCHRKTDDEIAEIEVKEALAKQTYEERLAQGDRPHKPKRYKKRVVSNRLVFDDLAELPNLISNDNELMEFVIIPPVAFSGKNRTKANAYHLWAIAIDLDGVEMDQLEDLIYQINNDVVPEPTFIANSGHGLHLYYCFEDPVPMYPHLTKQLQELKHALTDCVWNGYTSTIPTERRQYQSIVQGYRAVGSFTKLGKQYRVTAFRTGVKRTIQYLEDWASETGRVNFDEFNHVTLDQARELWPDWYQRRIVEGKGRTPFKFQHRGVYESWLRRMELGAIDGNRYNCISVLFAVAYKTEGIEFDDVMNDALDLVPRLNRLTKKEGNNFTEDDVLDASAFYDESSQTLGLKGVYKMTKIHIEPNKRNGRNQEEHLEEARMLRDLRMKRQGREWANKNGRPKGCRNKKHEKRDLVLQYRSDNPEASVTEVARALGFSRTTVYKWWDGDPVEPVLSKPIIHEKAKKAKADQASRTPAGTVELEKTGDLGIPMNPGQGGKKLTWQDMLELAQESGLSYDDVQSLMETFKAEAFIKKAKTNK